MLLTDFSTYVETRKCFFRSSIFSWLEKKNVTANSLGPSAVGFVPVYGGSFSGSRSRLSRSRSSLFVLHDSTRLLNFSTLEPLPVVFDIKFEIPIFSRIDRCNSPYNIRLGNYKRVIILDENKQLLIPVYLLQHSNKEVRINLY